MIKVGVLAVLAIAVGTGRDARVIVRGLEAHYHDARTLKAAFLERYSQGGQATQVESGTVYFARSGRMRWEYESPETKLFLVDGKNVWFYVPVDRTASRATLRESSDWRTPLALLAGKVNLARLCGSLELAGPGTDSAGATVAESGNRVLRCLPRGERTATSETYFREVLFEVDFEFRLVRVVIRQAGDIETDFRFGNWEENAIVPESKFHFEPPPGVAIVDEASLAGEIH
ncbi:MAG: outer membrane lipoprotein carrier protein LolA [Candidatus Acidiferrales bacterium]